jgi:hypothetical protein
MNQAPPSGPQLSPDGRFFWNGTAWQPVPPAAPVQKSRSPVGCIALAVIAVLIVGGIIALSLGGHSSSSSLKLSADARGLHPSTVGEEGGESLAITNEDTAIKDLVIFYSDGSDNWLDHHVVTSADGCSIDKEIKAFRCGPLAAGASRTITITATAKDRGNFSYGWGLGDAPSGGSLRQWDKRFTWTEAVT